MKKIIYVLSLFIITASVYSATLKKTDTLELSRKGAVEFALQNNLELKAVKAGIDAAKGRDLQSGRLDNPRLDLDYGNDKTFKNEGEYDIRVGLKQKFPLFGRLTEEKKIAKIDVKLAEMEYAQAEIELAKEVETAYVNVLEITASIAAKRGLLKITEKLAQDLKTASANAELSPLEARRAQSESAKLSLEIMEDEVAKTTAFAALKIALGINENAKIKLGEKLAPIPALKKHITPEALENRPDWQMYAIATQSQSAQIALIKASKYEDVEVGIFFEDKYETDQPEGKDHAQRLRLALSIPLPFNSFDGSISEKLALRRKAETMLAAKEIKIRNEVSLYMVRDKKYSDIIKKYTDELKSGDQIYADYIQARRQAQASLTDVFSACETNLRLNLLKIGITASQAKNAILLNYSFGMDKINEK